MQSGPSAGLERFGAGIAVLITLAIIWLPRWPPLADLPQHGAQIAMLLSWNDEPRPQTLDLFRLNLLTPYLFGYGLTWAVAQAVPVVTALKVVLSGAVLAQPLVARRLAISAGSDPSWALLMFPVAMALPFWWGMLNYIVGLPVLLAFVAVAVRYSSDPTPGRAAGLVLLGLLLLPVHAVIAALAVGLGALLVASRAPEWRRAIVQLVPLLFVVGALVTWIVATRSAEAQVHTPILWRLGAHRGIELFAYLVSLEATLGAFVAGLGLVVLPLLAGGRPSRTPWRLLPLALVLLAFFVLPELFFGTALIYGRLACVAYPLWLMALEPPRRPVPLGIRVLMVSLPILWMTSTAVRMIRFDRETAGLAALLEQVPPDQRVLSLVFDRDGVMPPVAYVHLPAWYVSERGGVVDFSFAFFYPEVVRYREEALPPLPGGVDFMPELFRWDEHGGELWQWYVVSSHRERTDELFGGAARTVTVAGRDGSWWLYRVEAADVP